MNLASRLIAKSKGLDPEEVQEREPNAAWDSYRYRQPSPRVRRRLQIRDVLNADRKRRRAVRRQERGIHVITEREAVRRVRAWEAENGSALTHLLRTGAYTDDDVLDGHGIPFFDIADKLGLLTEVDES